MAIEYILKVGYTVLAHPGLIKDRAIIEELVENNLKGIEVFHTKHNQIW